MIANQTHCLLPPSKFGEKFASWSMAKVLFRDFYKGFDWLKRPPSHTLKWETSALVSMHAVDCLHKEKESTRYCQMTCIYDYMYISNTFWKSMSAFPKFTTFPDWSHLSQMFVHTLVIVHDDKVTRSSSANTSVYLLVLPMPITVDLPPGPWVFGRRLESKSDPFWPIREIWISSGLYGFVAWLTER